MGELVMATLMMTMPALCRPVQPTLTYSGAEIVQRSYLLLHHCVPAFRPTLCLSVLTFLTLELTHSYLVCYSLRYLSEVK